MKSPPRTMRQCIHIVALLALIPGCTRSPLAKTPVINQAIFEPVYRSAKSVEGAIDVGVNYAKLGELLQVFSTELSHREGQGEDT